MNKKVNTVLFLVAASIITSLVALLLIIVPIVILIVIFKDKFAEFAPAVIPLIFLGGIIGSFAIYAFAMKKFSKKVDMNTYFSPILTKKK